MKKSIYFLFSFVVLYAEDVDNGSGGGGSGGGAFNPFSTSSGATDALSDAAASVSNVGFGMLGVFVAVFIFISILSMFKKDRKKTATQGKEPDITVNYFFDCKK